MCVLRTNLWLHWVQHQLFLRDHDSWTWRQAATWGSETDGAGSHRPLAGRGSRPSGAPLVELGSSGPERAHRPDAAVLVSTGGQALCVVLWMWFCFVIVSLRCRGAFGGFQMRLLFHFLADVHLLLLQGVFVVSCEKIKEKQRKVL